MTAIVIGLDLKTYWEISPKQFEKHLRAYEKKEELEAKKIDAHAYNLGKYISYAYHSTKKYPKKPFLSKEPEMRAMTSEEMERVAKNITYKLKNGASRFRNTHHSEHSSA